MNVLLTGATGFVGQCVLFMLIRKEPLEKCFVIARPGKGGAAKDRIFLALNNMGMNPLEYESKIEVIDHALDNGPIFSEKLSNVNIVVNCAASVRFDLSRAEAIHQNLGIVRYVFETALKLKNLCRIIHVSTAFVNPHPDTGEKDILRFSSVESIEKFTSDRSQPMGYHPNTYTLSKNLSEEWIRLSCAKKRIPLSIVRPSIVTGAVKYPYEGWVGDSPVGLHAFLIAFQKGVMKYVDTPSHMKIQIVPVDVTAETIINQCRFTLDEIKANGQQILRDKSTHENDTTNIDKEQPSILPSKRLNSPTKSKCMYVVKHSAIPVEYLFSTDDIAKEAPRVTGYPFEFRPPNLCDRFKEKLLLVGSKCLGYYWQAKGNRRKAEQFKTMYTRMIRMKEIYKYFDERHWEFDSDPEKEGGEVYETYKADLMNYYEHMYFALKRRFIEGKKSAFD